MNMTKETRRTWAEIHLDRLAHNYRLLRERAPHSKFVGLVKANAYGHGAVPVAKKLEALGADYLAVACLDEAEQLRDRALEEYDRERDAEKKDTIVQRLKEQLNRI